MEEKTSEKTNDTLSSPSVKHKRKLSPWMVVSITIVIVLIFGSIAVYLFSKDSTPGSQDLQVTNETTPSQAPDANWQTYTNTTYHYSIQYPNDWSVREFPDSQSGAAFNPIDNPGYPDKSDSILISVGQTSISYFNISFEEYVKTAATEEIQNYNKLASLNKITTIDGVVGYETTWMVQPISVMGRSSDSKESESLPITYFEVPGSKTLLLRVTLDREEDLGIYEEMLKTVKITTPLDSTLTPTIDEAAVLKFAIKKYIALKHSANENSFTITVSKVEGNYAQGGVSDEGGGGMWFAAKEDGVWKLVWDGNGIILCTDLLLYPDFPSSMIPACYDEAMQDTINR